MAVVTESWVADILMLLASLLLALYLYINSTHNFFKDRGIPYLRPLPFVGIVQALTQSQHDLAHFLYNKFPNEKFYGVFQVKKPTLVVKDPELVQRIMVKNFGNFHDRGFPAVEDDVMSKNLFNLEGQTWRILRQKLISTFSTGKLKLMFDQFLKSGDNLLEEVETIIEKGEPVEARIFGMNFTTEVIGSTAFGLDVSKNNPQREEFNSNIQKVFPTGILQAIYFLIMMIEPKILSFFKVSPFLDPNATNYFINLVKATKIYRQKNGTKRNDYFQLLLSLQEAEESGKAMTLTAKDDNTEEDALINQMEYTPQDSSSEKVPKKLFTDEMVTAQAFVFLSGGSDTVASTLSFMLYQIGKHATVQERLFQEIDESLAKHGSWSYQAVKDMVYLDQVMQETQRMYPAISVHSRKVTSPYTIPDSSIVIDKGTIIWIPIAAIQRDPKYYPNPNDFNPDRWAPDNNYKPNPTYSPFGDGPRICIAMRFAILEMKVCLAKILSQYSVQVNSKTQEPFELDRKSFFPRPKTGFWIDFVKRTHKS